MKEFNIGIYKLDSRKSTIEESIFNELLEEHKELWKDEIETYKFKKVNLKLRATPIFVRPRSVPFAFKDRVE